MIVSRRQNKFGLPKPPFSQPVRLLQFLKRKGAAGQELLIYLRTTNNLCGLEQSNREPFV
jgi:hypothetical protein